MAIQNINVGTIPNDGTGDPLRNAFIKTNDNFNDVTLTIYNPSGQEVHKTQINSGQTYSFSRDNLPSGLYFVRLTEDDKILDTQKLIITE